MHIILKPIISFMIRFRLAMYSKQPRCCTRNCLRC